ncbi:MAG: SDR family oxidoreductase [Gammaproteobacteria bacterium]|nr:SDR family oxidoreductase [Gammaproteobacteria bacterium]
MNERGTILVTGAGRRVGLHVAHSLLRDGFGVIAHYHSESDGVAALAAAGATTIQADLTQTAEVHRLLAAVTTGHAHLRGIIHNASLFETTREDTDEALAQYERFVSIHMRAPWLINTTLAPLLAGEGDDPADIIHLTDIFADNPNPAFDLYCSTKAGLQNLTLSFAKRLAPGVKVNAIQPGPVLFKDSHTAAAREQVLQETLLGREGGAEAIYRAVKALLDNPYITGASLPVDGGRRLAQRV